MLEPTQTMTIPPRPTAADLEPTNHELTDRIATGVITAVPILAHAFPTSARHGLRRWEQALDPSGLVIRLLEVSGLAWDVVSVSPERQAQKTLA